MRGQRRRAAASAGVEIHRAIEDYVDELLAKQQALSQLKQEAAQREIDELRQSVSQLLDSREFDEGGRVQPSVRAEYASSSQITIRDLDCSRLLPLELPGAQKGCTACGGDVGERPIHVLDLAGMPVSSAVLGAVPGQLLALPTVLTSVDLSQSGLGEEHASGLLELLQLGQAPKHSRKRKRSSKPQLGDEGERAAGSRSDKRQQSPGTDHPEYKDDFDNDEEALLDGAAHGGLRALVLADNPAMGVGCAGALAAGLATNRSIRCFDATGCYFGGDAGRGVVLEASLGNKGLAHIGLSLVDHSASLSLVRRGGLDALADGLGRAGSEREGHGRGKKGHSRRKGGGGKRSRSRSRGRGRGASGLESHREGGEKDPQEREEEELYGIGPEYAGMHFGGSLQEGGPQVTEPSSGVDDEGKQLLGGTEHLLRAIGRGLDMAAARGALSAIADRLLQDPAAYGPPASAGGKGGKKKRKGSGRGSRPKSGLGRGTRRGHASSSSLSLLSPGGASTNAPAGEGILSLSLRCSRLDPVLLRDFVTGRRAVWALHRALLKALGRGEDDDEKDVERGSVAGRRGRTGQHRLSGRHDDGKASKGHSHNGRAAGEHPVVEAAAEFFRVARFLGDLRRLDVSRSMVGARGVASISDALQAPCIPDAVVGLFDEWWARDVAPWVHRAVADQAREALQHVHDGKADKASKAARGKKGAGSSKSKGGKARGRSSSKHRGSSSSRKRKGKQHHGSGENPLVDIEQAMSLLDLASKAGFPRRLDTPCARGATGTDRGSDRNEYGDEDGPMPSEVGPWTSSESSRPRGSGDRVVAGGVDGSSEVSFASLVRTTLDRVGSLAAGTTRGAIESCVPYVPSPFAPVSSGRFQPSRDGVLSPPSSNGEALELTGEGVAQLAGTGWSRYYAGPAVQRPALASLQSLDLSFSGIDSGACRCLWKAAAEHGSMVRLALRSNPRVGARGASECASDLCEAWLDAPEEARPGADTKPEAGSDWAFRLRLLDLRGCGVTSAGAVDLQRATNVVGAPVAWFGDGRQGTVDVLWALEENGLLLDTESSALPGTPGIRDHDRGVASTTGSAPAEMVASKAGLDFGGCVDDGALEATAVHSPSAVAGDLRQAALLAMGRLLPPEGWVPRRAIGAGDDIRGDGTRLRSDAEADAPQGDDFGKVSGRGGGAASGYEDEAAAERRSDVVDATQRTFLARENAYGRSKYTKTADLFSPDGPAGGAAARFSRVTSAQTSQVKEGSLPSLEHWVTTGDAHPAVCKTLSGGALTAHARRTKALLGPAQLRAPLAELVAEDGGTGLLRCSKPALELRLPPVKAAESSHPQAAGAGCALLEWRMAAFLGVAKGGGGREAEQLESSRLPTSLAASRALCLAWVVCVEDSSTGVTSGAGVRCGGWRLVAVGPMGAAGGGAAERLDARAWSLESGNSAIGGTRHTDIAGGDPAAVPPLGDRVGVYGEGAAWQRLESPLGGDSDGRPAPGAVGDEISRSVRFEGEGSPVEGAEVPGALHDGTARSPGSIRERLFLATEGVPRRLELGFLASSSGEMGTARSDQRLLVGASDRLQAPCVLAYAHRWHTVVLPSWAAGRRAQLRVVLVSRDGAEQLLRCKPEEVRMAAHVLYAGVSVAVGLGDGGDGRREATDASGAAEESEGVFSWSFA